MSTRRAPARIGNAGEAPAPTCSRCDGSGKEPAPVPPLLVTTLDIKTVSEPNVTGRLRAKLKRKKMQRQTAHVHLLALVGRNEGGPPSMCSPLVVTLTRIAPRTLDSDNVHGALKHVRDGVADWLGVDDGDARVTWEVGQERGAAQQYAVRVEIRRGKR
jgi:hypothetical protein